MCAYSGWVRKEGGWLVSSVGPAMDRVDDISSKKEWGITRDSEGRSRVGLAYMGDSPFPSSYTTSEYYGFNKSGDWTIIKGWLDGKMKASDWISNLNLEGISSLAVISMITCQEEDDDLFSAPLHATSEIVMSLSGSITQMLDETPQIFPYLGNNEGDRKKGDGVVFINLISRKIKEQGQHGALKYLVNLPYSVHAAMIRKDGKEVNLVHSQKPINTPYSHYATDKGGIIFANLAESIREIDQNANPVFLPAGEIFSYNTSR